MSNQINQFKERLLQEIGILEFRFNLKTNLSERIRNTENNNELYDCFNEMERIETVMKKIYDLIDTVYDKILEITPNELHNTILTNKHILRIKISKEAYVLEFNIELLTNIIETHVKDELDLIKSWTKAI